MNANRRQYGVLTGDLVGSSKVSPTELRKTMKVLRESASEFGDAFPNSVWGELDVFSGDGWQLLMSRHVLSLRAAVFLRCRVKGVENVKLDSRTAIAWGAIDEEAVNPKRVSEATGAAFTASGRALKEMPKRRRFAVAPPDSGPDTGFLDAAIGLLDELAGHWTARQAQTLALALLNKNQKEIAAAMGKKQPTIYKALLTAGWGAVEGLLEEIENRLKDL